MTNQEIAAYLEEKLARPVAPEETFAPVRTGLVRKYQRHTRFAADDRKHSHGWTLSREAKRIIKQKGN